MSTKTANLLLVKPATNEFFSIDIQNENMELLDAAIIAKETTIGSQAKADAAALASIPKSLATAANDTLFASGTGAWVKKTLAEAKTLLGITLSGLLTLLGDSFFKQSNYGVIKPQGTGFTLTLASANSVYIMTSGSSQTITVPANSVVALPIGTQITFIMQSAAMVVFAPATGAGIMSKDQKRVIDGQSSSATLIKSDVDLWMLIGSLKA